MQGDKVKYELLHTALASKEFTNKELLKISNQLSIRNQKFNITGCLIYKDREFFQILEGEKEVLMNLLDTVKDDTRHGNIHILWQGEVEHYGFKNWGFHTSMIPSLGLNAIFAEQTEHQTMSKQLLEELSNFSKV